MKIHNDESIFIDFLLQNEENIPDGFSSSYKIINSNKEVVKTGELSINENQNAFLLRIKSNETKELEKGIYTLQVTVQNEDSGYKDYIFETELEIIDV